MNSAIRGLAAVVVLTATMAGMGKADETDASQRDRRRLEGTWRIVALEINGNKAQDQDARKLTVVNGPGVTWRLLSEGQEVARGTNSLDSAHKPSAIDITITEGGGKGNVHRGIYELGEKTRRLCIAAVGKERPATFAAPAGSEQILVQFEREK